MTQESGVQSLESGQYGDIVKIDMYSILFLLNFHSRGRKIKYIVIMIIMSSSSLCVSDPRLKLQEQCELKNSSVVFGTMGM